MKRKRVAYTPELTNRRRLLQKQAVPTGTVGAADKDEEALQAIEEIAAEFGLRATVGAILKSTLGDALNKTGSGDAALRITQVILRQIAYSKNPQLEAEIMALGCGVILHDKGNQTAIARKHGLTRSAVSKRVVQFVEENGLPPSIFMRSEKDRATYSLTNKPRGR